MYKRCIRTKWAKKCAYAVFQAHIWIYKKITWREYVRTVRMLLTCS